MADTSSPKHGSSPKMFPDRDKNKSPEEHASESQPDGTAADAPRGETQAQPNAGKSGASPRLRSETPENRIGEINPSAPTDATEIANVLKDLPQNPTMDSAGEIGDPSGRGTLDIDPEVFEEDEKKRDKAA
jgi:hypothetical protein